MSEQLTKANFDPHLNTTFEIHAEGGDTIEAELVKIEAKQSEWVESFSVIFRGPKEPVLPHETHQVKHPEMGELNLFMGPIVYEKQDGIYYEAVFTRSKEEK